MSYLSLQAQSCSKLTRLTSDVNSRPLAPCDIHKLINDLFSRSTFSRYAASHLIDTSADNTSAQEESAAAQNTKAIRKSPKKVSERYPIFVFNLKIDMGMVDVTLEPEKRVVEFQVNFLFLSSLRPVLSPLISCRIQRLSITTLRKLFVLF